MMDKTTDVLFRSFQDIICEYTGNQPLNGRLAELLGELVSESRMIELRIAHNIDAQEREERKEK